MRRTPFKLGEIEFDLSHLDDFAFELVIPAKDGKPEQRYEIAVQFSMHCFTTTAYAIDGTWPRELEYSESDRSESDERRLFDQERYELSKRLREFMRTIGGRKCYHADGGNFFVVEGVDGRPYHIFFKVWQSEKREALTLQVVSAYVPDGDIPVPRRKKVPPIRFSVIAYNTKHGKPIKRPE